MCLRNPESWALESGIQLKESGILLKIGNQNPSSTDKDVNPLPGNPESTAWNPERKTFLDSLTRAIVRILRVTFALAAVSAHAKETQIIFIENNIL